MEPWFVPGSLWHSPLVVGVRAGTLSFKAFVVSHVSLIFLDRLIHLMWGQLTMSGYLRVQNMLDLLLDSIQGDFILEGLQLFIRELVFPIFAKIANRGTHPDPHGLFDKGSQPCSSVPGRYKSHSSAHEASVGEWGDPEPLPE